MAKKPAIPYNRQMAFRCWQVHQQAREAVGLYRAPDEWFDELSEKERSSWMRTWLLWLVEFAKP